MIDRVPVAKLALSMRISASTPLKTCRKKSAQAELGKARLRRLQ